MKIHSVFKSYFDLSSEEVKNPMGKVTLTALKALSLLTVAIPLIMWAGYVITQGSTTPLVTVHPKNAKQLIDP